MEFQNLHLVKYKKKCVYSIPIILDKTAKETLAKLDFYYHKPA